MSPYSILGISNDSSKDDIKKAYRKLAMKYHPDKGGDPKKFQEINNAYEELTSEKKSDMGQGFPFGFGQSSDPSGPDIFETFFGHTRQQHNRQQQKRTIKKQIKISMEEAYNGVKKTLNIKTEHDCDCRVKCVKCKGTGFVTVQIKQNVGHGFLVQTVRSHCNECSDGYKKSSSKCDKCNSTGKTQVEKKIEINIDKGVETGKSYLRDNVIDDAVLMFIIFIELEPNFEIVQNNIIFRQQIAFVDTIFGTTLLLKHPSGQTIQVNTRGFSNILTASTPHIIRGKGMTPKHNYEVHFKIDYPRVKTDEMLKDSIRSKFIELLN
jgi:DnaJ homolog subfamily A member 2